MVKLVIPALLMACYAFGQGFSFRDQPFLGNVNAVPHVQLTNVVPDLLWWKLNEGSGTTVAGDAATSDNGTTDADWSAGVSGSSLSMNGSSDRAYTDGNITWGTNILTVCGWLFLDERDMDHFVWATRSSADPYGAGANSASVAITASSVQGNLYGDSGWRRESVSAPAIGSWFHLLVVFDGSTETGDVRIFYNGAEQSLTLNANAHDGTSNFTTDGFIAGQRPPGQAIWYDGKMDDLRVYSGDRSDKALNIVDNPQ